LRERSGGRGPGAKRKLVQPTRWNRYTYAIGDPVNRADPRGLDDCGVDDGDESVCYYGDDDQGGGGSDPGGDSDESDQDAQVQPLVPAGNDYTQTQMQDLTDGLNDALDHLDPTKGLDCAQLLEPSDNENAADDAQTALENTLYRILPLGPSAGASTPTGSSNTVFVNANGAFFNATPNANGTVTVTMPNAAGVSTNYTFASAAVLQGFMLLHELGHETGAFGPDSGPANAAVNGQYSLSVLQDCFTQTNGVWQ